MAQCFGTCPHPVVSQVEEEHVSEVQMNQFIPSHHDSGQQAAMKQSHL